MKLSIRVDAFLKRAFSSFLVINCAIGISQTFVQYTLICKGMYSVKASEKALDDAHMRLKYVS